MKEPEIDPRKKEYILKFVTALIEFIKANDIEVGSVSKKIDEIEALFKGKKYLFGKLFYNLYKEYGFDLNSFCKSVFIASKAKMIISSTDSTNRLTLLLSPFLNSQKTFYASADIEKTRFSRILKLGRLDEIYADEVYGIAVAIGVEPLVLFEHFFEEAKHTTYDLALKILELYVPKEEDQSQKDTIKDTINLSPNQERILQEIIKNKYTTVEKLSAAVGINSANIQKNIKKLKDAGLIKHIGPTKGGHWEVIQK
ncbi:MarR family transcriptional regulator [Sphingobacterium paucimobilis]|uniref:ATP-dependent DNA helicase RecG C-terminal domain-containing protein n=1 Tax=Sphingobacterium paucimobilis HER1398 TaxID=1346330 RepID=U2J4U8_9SPHI|nr:winged helix-turn-helix transcriptional regulator [Sphingobacterium paucimobilis]ERJ57683.1 hypothetical protein M472_02780 [Sphingobacterium paucimobilis HER1398]